MKRIIVALLMESPGLYEVVKVGLKHAELDDETRKCIRECLDEVKRIKLRHMMNP